MRQRTSDNPVRARAFSLIEVLVAIGLVFILISLVLPSLGTIFSSARRTVCLSNLRTVSTIGMLYADEHSGELPPYTRYIELPSWRVDTGATGDAWSTALADAAGMTDYAVFACPAFPEEERVTVFMSSRHLVGTGRRSIRVSESTVPSAFLLFGDCTRRESYPPSFGLAERPFDDADKDDALGDNLVFADRFGPVAMHGSINNAAFADGHAEGVRADLAGVTFHPREMAGWSESGRIGGSR